MMFLLMFSLGVVVVFYCSEIELSSGATMKEWVILLYECVLACLPSPLQLRAKTALLYPHGINCILVILCS